MRPLRSRLVRRLFWDDIPLARVYNRHHARNSVTRELYFFPLRHSARATKVNADVMAVRGSESVLHAFWTAVEPSIIHEVGKKLALILIPTDSFLRIGGFQPSTERGGRIHWGLLRMSNSRLIVTKWPFGRGQPHHCFSTVIFGKYEKLLNLYRGRGHKFRTHLHRAEGGFTSTPCQFPIVLDLNGTNKCLFTRSWIRKPAQCDFHVVRQT